MLSHLVSSLTDCRRIEEHQGHASQARGSGRGGRRRGVAHVRSVKCGAGERTLEGGALRVRALGSASAGTEPPFAADTRVSPIAKSWRRNEVTTTAARLLVAADKIDIELNKNTKITHCSHKMNVLGVECEAFCKNILILLNGISCGAS